MAAAAAGLAVAPALGAQVIQRRTWPPLRRRTRITWNLHGEAFPLFRPGQTATASERINKLEFFDPLFGAERKGVVNPRLPRVINHARTIRFDEPGEYYLKINRGAGYLKAVVFAPDEGIPASLIRLFDFCVVNNLYLGAEDNVWYYRRADYLTEFFTAEQPMMLSCGPTHGVFRWLVRERFCLPARILTAPGTYYYNGEVMRQSHNVPEIYIPDYKKYVFMDLNFGMIPLWLDALELAEVAHGTWGDTATDAESLEDLNLRFHTSPATCPGRSEAWDLVNQYGSEGHLEFSASYAIDQPLNTNSRARAVRAFWGGPAYWGQDMKGIRPTGTEFLPGKYVFASYHHNKVLLDEAIAYIAGFDVKVDVYEPAMVRAMLQDGHTQAIAAREWVDRFPAAGV
ncbi:MAG TPA: hypothetical protein VF846_21150 [Thermoanaerobaculia bacterium]|jgi:hypothetical protein